jgi:prolyl-tRNA synthetase
MRWSQSLIPTLKEDPADAEAVSHKLMVRAGMVRQLAAGIYVYLPLGQRVMDKIAAIIREEMNAIGGQEITMPVIHPAELWQQSGRWDTIGGEMFRLKDRNQRDMCLGMTHEEVIAWLAAREIRSYRDLPQIWYQIQTKERDEARPKSGVLRTREFVMKDSYSLDRDAAGLDLQYEAHRKAYCRIYDRCGLKYFVVESDPGMMGGAGSHEFMAPSQAGEDRVAICGQCGYAANVELAVSRAPLPTFPSWSLEEVATPNAKTIAEVCAFLGIEPQLTIKSLVVMTEGGPALALVRGDHQLHERKLQRVVGAFRPAHREEILEATGGEAGFVGPVGLRLRTIADETLRTGCYVAGANKPDTHLRGVMPGTHFQAEYADLREANPGDGCTKCGAPLAVERAIEIGNIFKLGTKYSVSLGALYLDEQGQEQPIVMGSYGIGPARIAAAAIEQNYDRDGMIWPETIAPFDVHLLVVNAKDAKMAGMAEEVYGTLTATGLEVLYDDRDERGGVKFKDADLLGLPVRVTVGSRALREGVVEVRRRRTGQVETVTPAGIVAHVRALLGQSA